MNPSSPLQVLSPSVRNSRTPLSASRSRPRDSVSVSPLKSLRRNNEYKKPLSVFEDAENQTPDTMERPMNYKFDDFLSEDENDDVVHGGGGGGVRESSPFLEIPHNAGRSSVRNTPRKAMGAEMDTPAAGDGDGSTTPAVAAKAEDVNFGMETIPELDSDYGSHTPMGAPGVGRQGSDDDDIDITLGEINASHDDARDSHIHQDYSRNTPTKDNARETDARHEHEHDTQPDAHDGDMSSLSTFSAVANCDVADLEQARPPSAATKRPSEASLSPKKKTRYSSSPDENKSVSPQSPETTPSRPRPHAENDVFGATPTPKRSSNNLLDFTPNNSHLNLAAGRDNLLGSNRRSRFTSISPTKAGKAGATIARSPGKLSLIDYDMSAPSPQSIPTITPRELESMKSSFLSEITALKATLSGRDAEVGSLKVAVSDAERRVGDALEELRGESARREVLEAEQMEWERRSEEMEKELADMKCDMEESTKERDRLMQVIQKIEEANVSLEEKVASLEDRLASSTSNASASADTADDSKPASSSENMVTKEQMEKEKQDSIQKVAKDLHKLYKEKHETKVAALKKSYATRWEKRVSEAENKLKELTLENEKLKAAKPEASGGASSQTAASHSHSQRHTQKMQEKIDKLQQELSALRGDYDALKAQLETERVEKGELVAAVDEWLALQQEEPTSTSTSTSTPDSKRPRPTADEEEENDPESRREEPKSKRRRSTPVSDRKEEKAVDEGDQTPAPVGQQHRSISSGSNSSVSVTVPRTDGRSSRAPVVQGNGSAIGKTPATSRIARFAPSESSSAGSVSGSGNGSAIARPRSFAGPTPRVPRFGLNASKSGSNISNNGVSSASTSRISGPAAGPAGPSGFATSSRSGIMGSIERMGRSRGGNQGQSQGQGQGQHHASGN